MVRRSFSQRLTVRSSRFRYPAISFHESSRSLAGVSGEAGGHGGLITPIKGLSAKDAGSRTNRTLSKHPIQLSDQTGKYGHLGAARACPLRFNRPVPIVEKASWRVVKFHFEAGLWIQQVIRGTRITKVWYCRNDGREEH